MVKIADIVMRLFVLLGAAFAVFCLDVNTAYAQSQNCRSLTATLQQLERNPDFRRLSDSSQTQRRLEDAVQRAESSYVRTGCNAAAKRGEQLTSECRILAREVLASRADLKNMAGSVDTGNAIAQQREAVLQEMARFSCNSRSSASVNRQDVNQSRGNFFEQLFGAFGNFDGGGGVRDEGGFGGLGNYETVRTVCVRKSDGYYWPISYSTLVDYAQNDLTQCLEQCPGVDVDLYYYDNPGQEPEQMINLNGEAYTSLPSAFAYRTSYDRANSCKAAVNYGSIGLVAQDGGGNRAMITYGEALFPLPIRDPRSAPEAVVAQIEVAELVSVPLPRPRPPAPGEAPLPVAVKATAASDPVRIVQFGDRRVRIVGPDTPYAPTAAKGT